MAEVIKSIRTVINDEGTLSDEIPFGAEAENVSYLDDGNKKVSIQQKIEDIDLKKIDIDDYIAPNLIEGANAHTQKQPFTVTSAVSKWHDTGAKLKVEKGQTYTVSAKGVGHVTGSASTTFGFFSNASNPDAGTSYKTNFAESDSYTFTAVADEELTAMIATLENDLETNMVYDLKAELGTKKTPYIQNIKSKIDVSDYVGANLLVGANEYTESNKLKIESTVNAYLIVGDIYVDLVAGETYTFSLKAEGITKNDYFFAFFKDNVSLAPQGNMVLSFLYNDAINGVTFTASETQRIYLRLIIRANIGVTNYSVWDMKVELGTEKTKYIQNIEEKANSANLVGENLIYGGNGYIGDRYYQNNFKLKLQSTYMYADLIKGEIYTFSCDIKNNTYAHIFMCDETSNFDAQTLNNIVFIIDNHPNYPLQVTSKTPLVTFVCPKTGRYYLGTSGARSIDNIYFENLINNIKLERGTKATSYSPNPNEAVDPTQINPNLLIGGNHFTEDNPTLYNFTENASYWANTGMRAYLEEGKTYTLSFKIKTGYTTLMIAKGINYSSYQLQNYAHFSNNPDFFTQANMYYSKESPITFTVKTGFTDWYYLYVLPEWKKDSNTIVFSTNQFYDIKIEEGCIGTKYVPNLEYEKYLNMGGTNLLKGSRDFSGWIEHCNDNDIAGVGTLINQTYRDTYILEGNIITGPQRLVAWNIPFKENVTAYTFSFYAMGRGFLKAYFINSSIKFIMSSMGEESKSSNNERGSYFALNKTWTKCWITFILNNPIQNGKKGRIQISLQSNSRCYISNCMFEEGIIAHSWCPNPSDNPEREELGINLINSENIAEENVLFIDSSSEDLSYQRIQIVPRVILKKNKVYRVKFNSTTEYLPYLDQKNKLGICIGSNEIILPCKDSIILATKDSNEAYFCYKRSGTDITLIKDLTITETSTDFNKVRNENGNIIPTTHYCNLKDIAETDWNKYKFKGTFSQDIDSSSGVRFLLNSQNFSFSTNDIVFVDNISLNVTNFLDFGYYRFTNSSFNKTSENNWIIGPPYTTYLGKEINVEEEEHGSHNIKNLQPYEATEYNFIGKFNQMRSSGNSIAIVLGQGFIASDVFPGDLLYLDVSTMGSAFIETGYYKLTNVQAVDQQIFIRDPDSKMNATYLGKTFYD